MTAFDPRQRYASHLEAAQTSHDGRQAQLHTAMPAIVVSYNPSANTVNVQPAIQGLRTRSDGTVHPVKIAELHDVPVCFQGGGGHMLTFPIKPGDDCLIIFAERSIDHWWQLGTLNPPSDWRMHDINDGFALIGVRSLPKVPGGSGARSSGPAVSSSTVQLRSDNGMIVMDLNPATNQITLTAPMGIVLDTPVVTVTGVINVTNTRGGGGAVGTFTGALNATGEITAKAGTSASVTVTQHRHPSVGSPPTPGT